MNKESYRNLKQNQDLSDEEFEQRWLEYNEKKQLSSAPSEEKIEEIMDQFAEEYDLSDMNVNDRLQLRQFASLSLALDHAENLLHQYQADGEIGKVDALVSNIKELSLTLSRIQGDLGISRKSRQSDKAESLEDYLPEIQRKAKSFYKERLAHIYCPKCRMLVATMWFADWHVPNTVNLVCPREECQHQFTVTSEGLTSNRNKNIDGVLEI